MKFYASERESAELAGELCFLCGEEIEDDPAAKAWDVLVNWPGTRWHETYRYYHFDCLDTDDEEITVQ